jgi:hypothetical protein
MVPTLEPPSRETPPLTELHWTPLLRLLLDVAPPSLALLPCRLWRGVRSVFPTTSHCFPERHIQRLFGRLLLLGFPLQFCSTNIQTDTHTHSYVISSPLLLPLFVPSVVQLGFESSWRSSASSTIWAFGGGVVFPFPLPFCLFPFLEVTHCLSLFVIGCSPLSPCVRFLHGPVIHLLRSHLSRVLRRDC